MISRPGEAGIGIPEPLGNGRLTGHRSVIVIVCVLQANNSGGPSGHVWHRAFAEIGLEV